MKQIVHTALEVFNNSGCQGCSAYGFRSRGPDFSGSFLRNFSPKIRNAGNLSLHSMNLTSGLSGLCPENSCEQGLDKGTTQHAKKPPVSTPSCLSHGFVRPIKPVQKANLLLSSGLLTTAPAVSSDAVDASNG